MPSPYFQHTPWPDFDYNGTVYSLSHLVEHEFTIIDSSKVERCVVVTYTDHCFTQTPEPGADTALFYPHCSRGKEAHFSLDRYQHSLSLPVFVPAVANGKVWNVEGKNYALLPTIDHNGQRMLYAIIFSLDPVKGLPVDLHMRISTAYPHSGEELVTYGSVGFSHLATLRMRKQTPKLIFDRGRKRPRIIEQKK
jgi:hypothetical protein